MPEESFRQPGHSLGLLEVIRQPYLTYLIVHKELRARYRGSIFGMLWSYAKPATQFLVFYIAIGKFMKMEDSTDNYVIYMFAGIIAINYFSEIFGNATRSIVGNAALVKKIYLPRELFPVASLWVAFVHFFPQVVILVIGALFAGFAPTLLQIVAVIAGFFIISFFALGLGLLAGTMNVFFRDAENFVDLILMVATWISPVLYNWDMVEKVLGHRWDGILWIIYLINPMTAAVELFHYGFWGATNPVVGPTVLPDLPMWTLIGLAISVGTVIFGEITFRRYDPRFAQEL